MKIKVTKKFFVAGQKGYEAGKEYDVTEEVGNSLLKRHLAVKAEEKKEQAEKPKEEEPRQEKKQYKQSTKQ